MRSTPRSLASPLVINIHDLRRLAHGRLPKVVFDYPDGGAESELTLRENCRVFDDVTFRPRQAVAIPECDLHTRVLSADLAFPAILAPIGYSRLMHPGGEVAAAASAEEAGLAYTLSTISGHKLENVRAASNAPVWYQLYLVGGREVAEGAIDRARRAGFSALVVTIDTPMAGMCERDPRNGMKELLGGSIFSKLPFLPQMFTHPRWLVPFLMDGGVPKLENIVIPGKGPMSLIDPGCRHWEDIRWLKRVWTGPIVVKGVLTADDGKRAVDEGAAAIVVSNHGGRQLDGAPATLRVLPEVVAAVNGQAEVLMDGGVRRGSDIVKAICLGARAVLLGRAYAFGLAAAGKAGVTRALEILRNDVERTLRLLGCPSVSALNSSYLNIPRHWQTSASNTR